MRFRFIEEHRCSFPSNRLCDVVGVSARGLRAFRSRPASCRQRSDLGTLAHIKEQSRLSLGSYGRPRMTEELKEIGLNVGYRRVGRLMRQNGISVVRTRKHKVRRVKNLIWGIKFTDARQTVITSSTLRPIFWIGTSLQMNLTKNGRVISAIFGRRRVGYIWLLFLTYIHGASLDGL